MKKNLEILKTSGLFAGIAETDIEALLSCLMARTALYEKNAVILAAGEKAENFGIVLSGRIQIVQDDYYGNRSILARADAGDLFAESFACAEVKALPVSVLAASSSELLFISGRRLAAPCAMACAFHRQLIRNMLGIVSSKNIALTQKMEFLSKGTTREKLLAYLSAEAQKAGSGRFLIPFNRQELADYLLVDRSALSAELGKLRDKKVLSFYKNQFELL